MFEGITKIDSTITTEELAAHCLVCDNPIPVYSIYDSRVKICNKCKAAILHIRKQLESED